MNKSLFKRSDCLPGGFNSARPCPILSCRYHLNHERRQNRTYKRLPDKSETCALDVADGNGRTLEEVGVIMGITREGVRQIEVKALKRMGSKLHNIGIHTLRQEWNK